MSQIRESGPGGLRPRSSQPGEQGPSEARATLASLPHVTVSEGARRDAQSPISWGRRQSRLRRALRFWARSKVSCLDNLSHWEKVADYLCIPSAQ